MDLHLPEWFQGWRPGQLEAVEEIVSHFERGVPLVLLDAPTGTGKTLIGEAVRQRLQTRGLYVCSSLTLQDQFAGDFPYAQILKGRSNYIPLHASGRLRSATCADCDKRDSGQGKECTYCDPVWACPYEVQKDATLKAELGNLNLRYYLTEANKVGRFSKLPFVIIDECDVLEQELMSFVEASVTNRMRKLLGLGMPKLKTVQDSWVEWFDRSLPKVEAKWLEMTPTEDDSLLDKRRYAAVSRLYEDLKRVAPLVAEGGWVYDGYQYGDIRFKPVRVDKVGHDNIWRHAERFLCMSATIVSPEEFVESVGYQGAWECVVMDSPFDRARRPVYYVPAARVTDAEKETEWPKLQRALGHIIDQHPDERILVHTVSYALAAHLEGGLASSRVRTYLDRSDRAAAIEWFESEPAGVLLASSLDRGYDGADDLVRVVVIAKLPFPYLGDKQVSARLHTPHGAMWYSVQTARSLVQMSGRGMRHENDWCKVIILDSMFEKFWRDWRRGVGRHALLPRWFSEAIEWGGRLRTELVRS